MQLQKAFVCDLVDFRENAFAWHIASDDLVSIDILARDERFPHALAHAFFRPDAYDRNEEKHGNSQPQLSTAAVST